MCVGYVSKNIHIYSKTLVFVLKNESADYFSHISLQNAISQKIAWELVVLASDRSWV